MEKHATIGRSSAIQLLLRPGEELRRHGVGGAIRGGRRSLARCPRAGAFITNVSARPADEAVYAAARNTCIGGVRSTFAVPSSPATVTPAAPISRPPSQTHGLIA